jgi:ABC-type uncharacterized transport system permease subunit
MAIYTTVATATSMAGMTFFGWITERFNEYTSVVGIGLVLFLLGITAAWFSWWGTNVSDSISGTGEPKGAQQEQ